MANMNPRWHLGAGSGLFSASNENYILISARIGHGEDVWPQTPVASWLSRSLGITSFHVELKESPAICKSRGMNREIWTHKDDGPAQCFIQYL